MKVRRLRKYRKPGTGELLSFDTKQYYVTDTGQVYDGERHRYVKQHENRKGYLVLNLRDNAGKQHTSILVHDLVATLFQRLLQKGEHVHHRDHCKTNNRLENIEIIDGGEHSRMHWKDGTMDGLAEKIRKARQDGRYNAVGDKLRKAWQDGCFDGHKKQVAQLDKDGRLLRVWSSTAECRSQGFSQGDVWMCCNGKQKTHNGYVWKFLEDYQKEQKEAQQLELDFSNT